MIDKLLFTPTLRKLYGRSLSPVSVSGFFTILFVSKFLWNKNLSTFSPLLEMTYFLHGQSTQEEIFIDRQEVTRNEIEK